MSTTSPFGLLGDDDSEDPTQLLASKQLNAPAQAPVQAKKAPAQDPAAQAKPPAKLPSKPVPPAQAVRESKNEDQRGGGRGAARGGRGFNRDVVDNENAFGNTNGFSRGYKLSEDGDAGKDSSDRRPYGGPRGGGGFRGGRRGGISNGKATEGERPRRAFDRHSGTGRGSGFKLEGAGRGNWGTPADEIAILPEDEFTVNESGSELSQVYEVEEDVHFGDGDNPRAGTDDVHGSGGSASDDDNNDGEGKHDESENSREVLEESDSSEDEVAPRNTIGDVPLEWYKDEEHIGYDLSGKKIKKKERQSKLDSFLASADDSKNWRKIYDEYNDEEVELTKMETKLVHRLLEGKAPHADFDPYAPYVDWFAWDGAKHPISNAPEPKRRFIPSKWESKMVLRYVRAIRKGLIKFDDKPKEEPRFYGLWDDDSTADRQGLAYIPAPKPKFPGHEESYNPSPEYIPTQEEVNSYQLMFEEDRPKFIPKMFKSLRGVPAYEKAVQETFDRCLDLYLCPRVRKKRINIDPESLKPKLPSRKDLKPYPTTCYLEYKGHKGPVTSISTEPTGQWIASGSKDGTVRIWEVETGRCLRIWDLGDAVEEVAWNPLPALSILAVAVRQDVFLLNTRVGNDEEHENIEELLHFEPQKVTDDNGLSASIIDWCQDDKHGGIRLKHFKAVTKVEWHRKGDYLSTLVPSGESRSVLIHQLSKKLTQRIPFKTKGIPVSTAFHPTRSVFFTATKKNVRVYDLLKQKLVKKLDAGVREISSIAIHPAGDNAIVGSKDGKLCWFDMDLSSRPYRVLRCHPKDITGVTYHRSYPLFASCSDDCTAYVFHGMVYSDLNENPLIVPLEILRGHASADGGVLDCKFHPKQPWLFTAGADSLIKLYCH